MTHKMDPAKITDLRERARQILRDRAFDGTLDAFERGDLDLERLLEELHIYHAELYLQQVALHESQRANERALVRFSRLYHELPFPALLVTWQGFVKEANASARRLLPLDRRLFSHLAVEGQAPLLENALLDARGTGRADCREVQLRGQGERTLTVDLRLIRLPEVEGDEAELVCNLVDQTEQVAARDDLITANRRLRIQEERYHIVADFAPDWAYWMGEDGRFRYVSPACGRISGYPAAAFMKDPELFTRIIHPDDRDLYQAHLHGAHSKTGPAPVQFRIRTRTGDLRWIEHLCTRVTGTNGRALGHRGSNLDVTDRMALEKALEKAAEVIDASSAVAFHWLPEQGWPIAYASANVHRWGHPIDRLISRELTYLDLVHAHDRDRLVGAFDAFLSEQRRAPSERREAFRHTYRVLWADGSEHWVDEETRCVYDEQGRLAYFHGIVIDVSERERAQGALKNQLSLQALVAEVSSNLVNADSNDIESVVETVLEKIGRFFKVDRCCIFLFSDGCESMDMIHEWCTEGITPRIQQRRDGGVGAAPWWAEQLRTRKTVRIADIRTLPPEAASERADAERESIRSLLRLPMTSKGQVIGALGLDTVTHGASWDEDDIGMLRVLCEVIAGFLVRVEAETKRLGSENRYRRVMAVMSDVAYSCTEDSGEGFRIDWITDSIEALTGYGADDVRAMRCWGRLVAPEDIEIFNQSVVGLQPGTTADCELRLRHRDGSIRWVRVTTESIEDADAPGARRLYGGLVDISDRKLLSKRLIHLSRYDPLTGLPNRIWMRERIEQALIDCRRNNAGLMLLSIDLDDLRSVNDSMGHRAGDQLLQEVAERWRPLLREDDTLARFSGDNFIALGIRASAARGAPTDVGSARGEGTAHLAGSIQSALHRPVILDGQAVVVTCSIGIALYPEDADTVEELIGHADAALHGAKMDGRGICRYYTSALNEGLQEQFRLEQALRRAIECRELLLHYQPRVEIESGRILGLEALVRWNHPDLGMISPNRFIPIAESNGLILLIGPMVVRLACEQIAAWRRAGVPVVPVALNLSANELYQDGLAGQICRIATEVGVDRALLDLEVTESAAMRSIDRAIEVLDELRDSGFKLAIDDFGTGYASLSYLNRLPVQTLKIDRSFLAEIGSGHPEESQAETIVKAIIGLGDNLGLGIIAEGVETATQRQFLIDHGCREAQGFFFGRPRPCEDTESLLRQGYVDVDELRKDGQGPLRNA